MSTTAAASDESSPKLNPNQSQQQVNAYSLQASAKDGTEGVEGEKDEKMKCRFYENQFPNIDECVVVTVNSIAEMGAYVTLVEYDNLEGMILLSELSRRRIRSISKLIRVGKTEIAMVMRVDKEKGYIDLSKRRVSKEEAEACEDRFNKAKIVYTIVRHVAETTHSNLLELMQKIAWPLSRKYKSAYDAFQMAVSDENILKELELPSNVLKPLEASIRRRMTPQPVRIRADIDVTCFTEAGIDGIREALMVGENAGTEEIPLKIKLIAPPMYVILTTSLDKKKGIDVMTDAISAIEKKIKEFGGHLKVRQEPHATSQEDERNLAAEIEKHEMENREVDGDDDNESGDAA